GGRTRLGEERHLWSAAGSTADIEGRDAPSHLSALLWDEIAAASNCRVENCCNGLGLRFASGGEGLRHRYFQVVLVRPGAIARCACCSGTVDAGMSHHAVTVASPHNALPFRDFPHPIRVRVSLGARPVCEMQPYPAMR